MTQETLNELKKVIREVLPDSKDYSMIYYPPTSDGVCGYIRFFFKSENDDSVESYECKINSIAKENSMFVDKEDYRTLDLVADWDRRVEGEPYDGVDKIVDLKFDSYLQESSVSDENTVMFNTKEDSVSSECSEVVDRPSVRGRFLYDVGEAGKLGLLVGVAVMAGSLVAGTIKEGKCSKENLKKSAKRGIIAGGTMFLLGVGFTLLNRH